MPATLARKCTDTALGVFHCESMTDQGKFYDVLLDPDGRNTCTCIAFAMRRNKLVKQYREANRELADPLTLDECTCKHIQALQSQKSGCGWTSDSDEQHEYEAICPRCFADTEVYDQRDPETVDLDELMKDFLALKKKLKTANA
jgi:hypothetical protein